MIFKNIATNATAIPTIPTMIEMSDAKPPETSGEAARTNPNNPSGIDKIAKTSPHIACPEHERNMLPNDVTTAMIAPVPIRCGGRIE